MSDEAVSPLAHYQIIRRNGAVVSFQPDKIADAMKAFLAVYGIKGASEAESDYLTAAVVMFLRTEYLPRLSNSVVTHAEGTGGATHSCGLRASRRRPNRHGLRPVYWHWRVHDG